MRTGGTADEHPIIILRPVHIYVILRKTAYFSNEILKERNRYFLQFSRKSFLYMFSKPFFTLRLSHIHWGWGTVVKRLSYHDLGIS